MWKKMILGNVASYPFSRRNGRRYMIPSPDWILTFYFCKKGKSAARLIVGISDGNFSCKQLNASHASQGSIADHSIFLEQNRHIFVPL